MALLCIDGFDHYTASDLSDKRWGPVSMPNFTTGRFGGTAMYITASNNDRCAKNIGVNKNTVYFGFAVRKLTVGAPQATTSYPMIAVEDEAGVAQIKITPNASFGLNVYNGDGSTIGASADFTFNDIIWQYMEVKLTVHDTAGVVQIRINEQTVLNLTNVDTKYGSDFIRFIKLRPIYVNKYIAYDDFYVDDSQFHGNCRVRTFAPDADGVHSDFTRSGGSNDYEMVDDATPDDDSGYIYTLTKGQKSSFGITTGIIGVVKGMQLSNRVKALTTGQRRLKPLVRSGGADYKAPVSSIIPSTDYKYKSNIWQADPQDDAAWNQTKLEAAEFGLELVGGSTTTSTTSTTSTTTTT